LLWIPIFVTLFVFFIDKITGLFKKDKGNNKQVKTQTYVELMGKTIDENHEFFFEDFRKIIPKTVD
jgi:hypothetical protein